VIEIGYTLEGYDVNCDLDKEFNVQLWNAFMQNHSAKDSADVLGQNLFETFPELPEDWFRRKANSVFTQVEHICVIVYDVTEVAVNRLQIQAANAELKRLSRTDGLTGLLNRKTWENDLNEEFTIVMNMVREIDRTNSLDRQRRQGSLPS